MVLLYGLPEDPPIIKVYEELLILGADVIFLNQRNLKNYSFELSISEQLNGRINYKGNLLVDLRDIASAYIRPYDFTDLNEFEFIDTMSDDFKNASHFEYLLTTWADLFTGKIINKPSAMYSNHSKPMQSELNRRAGFLIPDTLITTDPDAVLLFKEKHKKIVYKSISGQRSIVTEFSGHGEETIEDIKNCPTQFQQYIEGTDYRVHVIGNEVFAAKINSEESDYRYSGKTEIDSTDLPAEIRDKCLLLTKQLGLNFSGIDLRCTSKNEWFCFEVNPSPGYSYFENYTGQPIAKTVARFLNENNLSSRNRIMKQVMHEDLHHGI